MSSNVEETGLSQEISATVTASIVLNQPVGTISAFWGAEADVTPGWLLCDGQTFHASRYPALAKILKGTTTPDLRGYFIRGLDPTGKVDPNGASRTIGSTQAQAFAEHTHSYLSLGQSDGHYSFFNGDASLFTSPFSGTTGAAGGGGETRPVNVALHYIIFAGFPQPRQ